MTLLEGGIEQLETAFQGLGLARKSSQCIITVFESAEVAHDSGAYLESDRYDSQCELSHGERQVVGIGKKIVLRLKLGEERTRSIANQATDRIPPRPSGSATCCVILLQ